MNTRLAAGMTVAALACAGLHWFPLSETHKRPTVTRRITGYIGGVLAILTGLAIATDRKTTLTALTVATSAGIATTGAYVIDAVLNNHYGRVA